MSLRFVAKKTNIFKLTSKSPEVFPLLTVVACGATFASVISYKTCMYTQDVRFDRKKRLNPYYYMNK